GACGRRRVRTEKAPCFFRDRVGLAVPPVVMPNEVVSCAPNRPSCLDVPHSVALAGKRVQLAIDELTGKRLAAAVGEVKEVQLRMDAPAAALGYLSIIDSIAVQVGERSRCVAMRVC